MWTWRGCTAAWRLVLALVLATQAQAAQFTNRSFESGDLQGWEHIGDTSVHGDELGIDPSHGRKAALLTTSVANYPMLKPKYGTEYGTGNFDLLYWLGLPEITFDEDGNIVPPEWVEYFAWRDAGNIVAEIGGHSGARQSVQLRAGDVVSFDWNHVGDWVDRAFAILYPSDGPFYRGTYAELSAPFVLPNTMNPWPCFSGVPTDPFCIYQTGWQHFSYVAPSDGDYTLVLGVFDRDDDGWLTALWLDNFRVGRVPEPNSLALIGLCLAGLAFTRRRKQ
jgi:hypothetical protein